MKNAYVVKHPNTGIWEFATGKTEDEAKVNAFQSRLPEFQIYASEMGIDNLDDIKKSLETTLIGQETEKGVQFNEAHIDL